MAKLKDLCFEIIEACPNECIFCSSCSRIDKKHIIDFELFKKTIDHLMVQGGIEEISISGGEPLLHPNLLDMITYCKNYGIRVVLFTSGIKRNVKASSESIQELQNRIYLGYKHRFPNLPESEIVSLTDKEMTIHNYYNEKPFTFISEDEMKYLRDIGLDKIVFDFQSSEVEHYVNLMGKKHYMEVVRSMIKASRIGLNTDVHFVPNKINYRDLSDLIDALNIIGIQQLSFLNFVPQGRGAINCDSLMLSKEEMVEFRESYNKYKDFFNGNIRVGIPLLRDSVHKCTAGLDKMVIKFDGTVLPCPAFKEYDLSVLNGMNIETPNIHTDLSRVRIKNGRRFKPLCKELYSFSGEVK